MTQPRLEPSDFQQLGLAIWHGHVSGMAEAHRHNEIELNYLTEGEISYLFSGHELVLSAKQLLVFWGALPHRLVFATKNSTMTWLTLPLATFLRFRLPEHLVQALLHGKPILEQHSKDHDHFLLQDWQKDLATADVERQYTLELELEARLRRLADGMRLEAVVYPNAKESQKAISKAALIAEYIGQHYLEPISLQSVAGAVGLNKNYASELFKETFAMTILEYLTQQRIAHAQRLLATTETGILAVAYAAGFGSVSRFYVAFEQACGCSPSLYRKRLRR